MDPSARQIVHYRGRLVTPRWRPVFVVVALLLGWNLVGNLLVPDAIYVPANVALATLLLAVSARAGTSRSALGIRREAVAHGWRLGMMVAGVMVGLVALAAVLPFTRQFLEDDRFVGISWIGALYQVLLRIPLGTALFEEVAFRGILLGMLLERTTTRRAAVVSSVLFGLWHIAPTAALLDVNRAGDFAAVLVVTGGVVVTTVAGLGFVWLRLRSASLLAPVLVHAAINSAAYGIGWVLVSG